MEVALWEQGTNQHLGNTKVLVSGSCTEDFSV